MQRYVVLKCGYISSWSIMPYIKITYLHIELFSWWKLISTCLLQPKSKPFADQGGTSVSGMTYTILYLLLQSWRQKLWRLNVADLLRPQHQQLKLITFVWCTSFKIIHILMRHKLHVSCSIIWHTILICSIQWRAK